ncbi:type I polyketide synthase [Gluconobacter thailandicus]|uniref:Type I polyketide synthase n=1 Tax=Gluconobacter thailandicus TaxID=257438 RepID=A0AAP9JI77_GLUTH|nr:type I polyketide synthase [Gluconobacter thailandicus]QEH96932.1 type I polyketide synthase [Gluconobacter thailandicus]
MVEYGDDIAIVGIGCRLPGGIETTKDLWTFLCEQKDASSEVPADRWGIKRFYDPEYETPNKTYMRRGSFISQKIDQMDPLFFGISPREASIMDPQQRLLLEVVWEAMEDAGILPAALANRRTGVFIGTFSLDWLVACGSPLNRPLITDHFAATAASATMLAARISHNLGFQGPCMSIDTACSSSLVAIHQACASLLRGESNVAVAGGVNIMVAPPASITMSKGHFLAADGRCKSFSADADGYGRGEGCGIVVLKRLADAQRDGDFIHAVIAGTGINQDGRTMSLTMPSEEAQRALLLEVAQKAKVTLDQIGYVEAHGTGTPVGDPIEARAIGTAIGQKRPVGHPLVVGSIKANLGHLEAAAGVVGLIKAVLCLQNKAVPPQANLTTLNPAIPFDELGLKIPQNQMASLSAETGEVHVGVNSFGYGGTNAVALLRSAPAYSPKRSAALKPSDALLLPVNAMGDASAKALATAYADLLEDANGPLAEDLCFSAGAYRTCLQSQTVIIGSDRQELVQELRKFADAKTSPRIVNGRRRNGSSLKPVFVFSGMGSQWKGMGQHLIHHAAPEVLKTAQCIDGLFSALSGWSIIDEILADRASSRIDETIVAQPAIFIIQIILAEIYRLHGVEPSAIVGHSVGEVAAAYISGALTVEDAVTVIYHRSQQQARLAGQGTMLAIGMSGHAAAQRFLGPYAESVSVAAYNSVRSCTLAGTQEALKAIATECHENGIFNSLLRVEIPYHSFMMDEVHDDLTAALATISPRAASDVLYSTVTGKRWGDDERHDAAYWFDNARKPVLFQDTIQDLFDKGERVFLEIGAHPVLGALIRETVQQLDGDVVIIPSLTRRDPEELAIARSIARLYMAGVPLDWGLLTGGVRTSLPHYPWSRSYFWAETELSRRDRLDGTVHPVLGIPVSASRPAWVADINRNYMPWLGDHKVDGICLFPAAGYIEGGLAVHHQVERTDAAIIEDLEIGQALLLDSLTPPTVNWAFDADTRILTVASVHGHEGDEEWVQHAKMRVLSNAPWDVMPVTPDDLYKDAPIDIPADQFYAGLAEHGFMYGPCFQAVKNLKVGENLAVATLTYDVEEEISDYFLHPAVLDGAFQALIGAGYNPAEERVFVPTGVRQILYRGGQHKDLVALATLTKRTDKGIEGDIRLYTPNGDPVAEIIGFRAKAIQKLKLTAIEESSPRLYRQTWLKTELLPLFAEPLSVAVFGRDTALLQRVQDVFSEQGVMVDLHAINTLDQAGLESSLQHIYDVVLYIPDLEGEPTGIEALEDVLRLTKALNTGSEDATTPTRFVVVTRGAVTLEDKGGVPVLTGQAALRGFVRGISSERPDFSLRIIDIGWNDAEPALLKYLCAEIMQTDAEDDILLRADERAVSRLIPSDEKSEPVLTPYSLSETSEKHSIGVKLTVGSNGSFDKLHYERIVFKEPGPGQVLFKTLAAALNFKDVLKATGLIPDSVIDDTFHGETLGMEASAEVVAVGEGVADFEVGARYVVSWPGCFASHFLADAKTIFALPLQGLGTPKEAATLPVAFITAYYGLSRLAQLSEGETVLIHAGTGGVGLAAIQLAKKTGARIFATAGSVEKREYLLKLGCHGVFDSRSLEFVESIKAATAGRGVDVVLNSLAGEGQSHSLSLVAPYGRFVEIGKKDIIENKGLPLAAFNENLSFFSLDLDRMMLERPALMRSLLDDVAKLLKTGAVEPLPYTDFPAARASDAFRLLASAKHIGKVVIDYEQLEDLWAYPLPRPKPGISKDGLYLVTGGMGGFGWATAQWLMSSGAQHLLLLGRTSAESTNIFEEIQSKRAGGFDIRTVQVDVSDESAMRSIIDEVSKGEVPLKGVFHCAGILDDALIHNLDRTRIRNVIRPKAEGAIVLDRLTSDLKLDYFVLYSSVTTQLGNVGQSAYIAANSVLTAIAENRWQKRQPALSIDWGAIGDVGMLARNETAARALELAGLRAMPAQRALKEIPSMLDLEIPSVTCMEIDWKKWAQVFPGAEQAARFSLVRLAEENAAGASARLATLATLPEDERLPYVVDQVKVLIAQTLHLDPSVIDGRARLSELGIDSLAGVELQTALRVEFGVEVSILVLARDESIQKMSQFLLNRIKIGQTAQLP